MTDHQKIIVGRVHDSTVCQSWHKGYAFEQSLCVQLYTNTAKMYLMLWLSYKASLVKEQVRHRLHGCCGVQYPLQAPRAKDRQGRAVRAKPFSSRRQNPANKCCTSGDTGSGRHRQTMYLGSLWENLTWLTETSCHSYKHQLIQLHMNPCCEHADTISGFWPPQSKSVAVSS